MRQIQLINDVPDEIITEIEQLAALQPAVAAAKALIKEYDDRLKTLADQSSDNMPDGVARGVPGIAHMLEIGVQPSIRSVTNLPRLIELLGIPTFLKVAKVNIGDVEKYVPEQQLVEVLTSAPRGSRPVKLVRRA